MTIQKFPKKLAEQMFDANVKFESILHVPTLTVSEQLPEKFEDFITDLESYAEEFIKQHPQLQCCIEKLIEHADELMDEDYAQQFARYCGELEFLIQIEFPTPRNFKFDEGGKYLSCSVGGWYRIEWIFAKNMQDAAEQAIQIATNCFKEEEQKARKEQGLEG